MILLSVIAIVLAVGAIGGLAWVFGQFRVLRYDLESEERAERGDPAIEAALEHLDSRTDAIRETVASLSEKVNDQTLAIAEGIERVDRAERRVRSAVGRARARMASLGYSDDALEAEAESLRHHHADDGVGEGVPPVHEDVASNPARDMSAFPGVW